MHIAYRTRLLLSLLAPLIASAPAGRGDGAMRSWDAGASATAANSEDEPAMPGMQWGTSGWFLKARSRYSLATIPNLPREGAHPRFVRSVNEVYAQRTGLFIRKISGLCAVVTFPIGEKSGRVQPQRKPARGSDRKSPGHLEYREIAKQRIAVCGRQLFAILEVQRFCLKAPAGSIGDEGLPPVVGRAAAAWRGAVRLRLQHDRLRPVHLGPQMNLNVIPGGTS
jgi:hypothetical protein